MFDLEEMCKTIKRESAARRFNGLTVTVTDKLTGHPGDGTDFLYFLLSSLFFFPPSNTKKEKTSTCYLAVSSVTSPSN